MPERGRHVFDLSLRPHDADDFLERVIPWDFDPDADCPTWTELLVH